LSFHWFISLLFCSSNTASLFLLISSCSGVLPPSSFVRDSNGFFSFSDSTDFSSRETELEVLGLAPVSEGVPKVPELADGDEAVVEASEIVGVETEVGKTFSSATDTAGVDRLVEAKDPKDEVVEAVVEVAVEDETAVVVLLSVITVVEDTAVELSEVADSVDAVVAEEEDAEVDAVAGMWVVFLATTALYCCISITAASSNTWMFRRQRIRASTAARS